MTGASPYALDGRLQLRPVETGDLPTIFLHQAERDGSRMASVASRDRAAFDAHWAKNLADPTVITRTVLLDGRVAGNVVSFERWEKREVGYWLGKEFWGLGIATWALSAFLKEVAIRPLFARVAKHNVASLRVVEKCGFRVHEEGSFTGPLGETIEEFVFVLGEAGT